MSVIRGVHSSYSVLDDVLSKGGIGAIHRTSDPDFVLKRYFDPAKAPTREHLERLIAVGREVLVAQGRKPGQTPESSVNWPVDLVPAASGTGVDAVVLPTIPPPLFHQEFGGVRGLEFLVMARADPPAAKARIVLLLRMAEILAFVNARGLIHGDVNGKNLAWSADPEPVMYLIDCDGMVPQQPAPMTGVQAMGWTDPRVVERRMPAHDQYSDWYALALAMYRGLLLTPGRLDRDTTGAWPPPSRIPAEFPSALGDLLRNGLAPLDADLRPTPKEWVDALIATYLPGQRFNETAIAELDELAATPPRAKTFVPLPQTNWGSFSQPKPTSPAPAGPPMTTSQRLLAPPPPGSRTTGSGQASSGLSVSMPAGGRLPVSSLGPVGSLAQSALQPAISWYLIGLAASLLLPPVALIYVCVAFYQLRDVDSGHPGLDRARISLTIFGGISLFTLLPLLASAFH